MSETEARARRRSSDKWKRMREHPAFEVAYECLAGAPSPSGALFIGDASDTSCRLGQGVWASDLIDALHRDAERHLEKGYKTIVYCVDGSRPACKEIGLRGKVQFTTPEVTEPEQAVRPVAADLAPDGAPYRVVVGEAEADPVAVDNQFLHWAAPLDGGEPLVTATHLGTGDSDTFGNVAVAEATTPAVVDRIFILHVGKWYKPRSGDLARQARLHLYWEMVYWRGDSAVKVDPTTVFPQLVDAVPGGGWKTGWPLPRHVSKTVLNALDDWQLIARVAASHCQTFTGTAGLTMRMKYEKWFLAMDEENGTDEGTGAMARAYFLYLASPVIASLGEELSWDDVEFDFGHVRLERRPKAARPIFYDPSETPPGRIFFLDDECGTLGYYSFAECLERFEALGLFDAKTADIADIVRAYVNDFELYSDDRFIDPRDVVVPVTRTQDVSHLDRTQRFISASGLSSGGIFAATPMAVGGRADLLTRLAELVCPAFADGSMFTHRMSFDGFMFGLDAQARQSILNGGQTLTEHYRLMRDMASVYHLEQMVELGNALCFSANADDPSSSALLARAAFSSKEPGQSAHNPLKNLFDRMLGGGGKAVESGDIWALQQHALQFHDYGEHVIDEEDDGAARARVPPNQFRAEAAKWIKANTQQLTSKIRSDQSGRLRRYDEALADVAKIVGADHWFVGEATLTLDAVRRRVTKQAETDEEVAAGAATAAGATMKEEDVLLCLHALCARLRIPGLKCVPDFQSDSLLFAAESSKTLRWWLGDSMTKVEKTARESAGHRAWGRRTRLAGVRFALAIDKNGKPTVAGARDVRCIFHQSREQTIKTLVRTARAIELYLPTGSARIQATSSPFLRLHGGPSMASFCWDDAGEGRLNWAAKEVHVAKARRGGRGAQNNKRARGSEHVSVSRVAGHRAPPPTADEKAAIREEKKRRHEHHLRRSRPMLTEANRLTLDFENEFKATHGFQKRALIFQVPALFAKYAMARREIIATAVPVKIGRLDDDKSDGLWTKAFLRPQRVLRDVDRAKQHRLAIRKNEILQGTGHGHGDLDVTLHWTHTNDMDKVTGSAMMAQRNKPAGSGNKSVYAHTRSATAFHRSPADAQRPRCTWCGGAEVAGCGARKMSRHRPSNSSFEDSAIQRIHRLECPTVSLCRCTGSNVALQLSNAPRNNGGRPATSTNGLKAGSLAVGNNFAKPVLPYGVSGLVGRYEPDRRRRAQEAAA